MSAPTRLILGYAAVIVILLGSVAVIVARTIQEMKSSIARDVETVAATYMDEIDSALRERIQTIRSVAGTSSELHRGLRQSNTRFEQLGDEEEIHRRIDADDAAWRAATAGEPTDLMNAVLGNNLSDLLHGTMDFHKGLHGVQVFAEIFVTNRYGANAGQTGRTSDYRQDDEGWWKEAWERGIHVARKVSTLR